MICVGHLVRKQNGLEPFKTFLRSYVEHPAGTPHELVLILKGFDPDESIDAYLASAGAAVSDVLYVPDTGFDVGAYVLTAKALDYDHFCFLNSFSIVRAGHWLSKMHKWIVQDGVGLVGASGSSASHYSYLLWELGLGGAYARVCEDDDLSWSEAAHVVRSGSEVGSDHSRVRQRLGASRRLRQVIGQFEAFPAYHVRTNAFLIACDVMRSINVGQIHSKWDAWRFESGKRSLTRQVEEMRLRAVVVGDNGRAYEKEEWFTSNTFWQGDQGNLLVADNQTNDYLTGDRARRVYLSGLAWGHRATPARAT